MASFSLRSTLTSRPLEDFLGPAIVPWFDRLFDGRELTILGYNRQRIPGNWKLMQENIKDPYHPGLLHTWFVTFGLWRADNRSQLVMDAHHRHAAHDLDARRAGQGGAGDAGGHASRSHMALEDPRFLDIVPEPWWNGPTAVMMTLFPSVILQPAGELGLDAAHPAGRPRGLRFRPGRTSALPMTAPR